MASNITHANMLVYPLYYDIISLTNLKITQAFYLLLGFVDNQIVIWYFKIPNSVRITEGLDNRGSTVLVDTKLPHYNIHGYHVSRKY